MSHRAVPETSAELLDPSQQAQYTEPIQVKLASCKAIPWFIAAVQPPRNDGEVLIFDLTWAVNPSTPDPTSLAPTTPGPQTDVLDVQVSCAGPSILPVIRDVGQSFHPLQYGYVDVIAVWISPGLSISPASYVLELWSGEFENVLHTTLEVNVDPMTEYEPGQTLTPLLYYFEFPANQYLLSPDSMYTWRLLNTSEYSGEVAACPDTIAGNAFGTNMSADNNYDLGFELLITPTMTSTSTPEPTPSGPEAVELVSPHPDLYENMVLPMKGFDFPALDPQG